MAGSDSSENAKTCPKHGDVCPWYDEVLALREEVQQLSEQARTDALTGLYNYRYFNEMLACEMERVQRTGQPLSLVLADVDHFKRFNDRHGHELGNKLLQKIAACFGQQLRKLDVACRYGGEEFALVLPATDLFEARAVTQRVRKAVAGISVSDAGSEFSTTMSFGIACYRPSHISSASELVELADAQLYQAKEQGRNRVCVAETQAKVESVTNEEKAALFAALRQDVDTPDS
ncbi:GGDEF domain-containing protein [Gilvimarinus sp. DA14]|uniref:GGDEF domain-containing protein n=1 Tax=Gilvimarinus sp. DA14 TaxID=2956798 RepID=UPI0020B8461F|nr:GGDEF domain-containing protein [Gilvimarinus sp. DA14]UTF60533.1 GGDEF domain-containing protein [Gilvimarinus sp. DA14]